MVFLGGVLVAGSFLGRRGLKFYKAVLNKEAFSKGGPMVVGHYYKGGFESPMTRREASLILGVR